MVFTILQPALRRFHVPDFSVQKAAFFRKPTDVPLLKQSTTSLYSIFRNEDGEVNHQRSVGQRRTVPLFESRHCDLSILLERCI